MHILEGSCGLFLQDVVERFGAHSGGGSVDHYVCTSKGLNEFPLNSWVWRQQEKHKTTPCHQGFQTRARFDHVSTRVRPRFRPRSEWVPFSVAGLYVGLVLGMRNCLEFTSLGQGIPGSAAASGNFFRTFGAQTSGTAAWTSGSLSSPSAQTFQKFSAMCRPWRIKFLAAFWVRSAWNPETCSSFRPKRLKNAIFLEECFVLQDF